MNQQLVEFRKSLCLSQLEMAESLGVSKSYYTKIELGLRNPSYNFIQKFKAKYSADIENIFFTTSLHKECNNRYVTA